MTAHTIEYAVDDNDATDDLRDVVRAACASFGGTRPAHRAADDEADDPTQWRTIGVDIGVASFGLPQQWGGYGGIRELACVAEELGRCLSPVPFLPTVFAGQILQHCDLTAEPLAKAITHGAVVTVAPAPQGIWDASRSRFTVNMDGSVSGHAPAVMFAPVADWIIAAAGNALYMVDATTRECVARSISSLDPSRRYGSVTLDHAPAVQLTADAGAALEQSMDIARIVLCAEQLGGMQACLESTVEYVKQRRQFGRPIGSFQAVKHTLADLLVQYEMSRSALDRALDHISGTPLMRAESASVAQIWCTDAYREITAETIQLHGGIGFTWENDSHLYFRRARSDAAMLGNPSYHRQRLATLLGW